MTAFRLTDPKPQWRDDLGNLIPGGTLEFYEAGTVSTPLDVYGEKELSTNNGSVIDLDSSSRAEVDIWLGEAAKVILKDADGDTVWERDYVQDQAAGGVVPLDPSTGDDGDVYRTDGVDAYWGPLNEVPDNTGHEGEYLTNDGELNYWAPLQAYDADNLPGGILDESNYVQIGNKMDQWGSGTATASGLYTTSVAVTFSPAFDSAPNVQITPNTGSLNDDGGYPEPAALSVTNTGFTASFHVGTEHFSSSSDHHINNAVNFSWRAIGSREP